MAGNAVPATARTDTPLHVHIVGWRGVSHSIALVNQWQMLELLKRPDIRLTFEDAPFPDPTWAPQPGLFSAAEADAISAVPPLGANERPDVSLFIPVQPIPGNRMNWPVVAFVPAEHLGPMLTDRYGAMQAFNDRRQFFYLGASRWVRDGFIAEGLDPQRMGILGHGVDHSLAPSSHLRGAARAHFKLSSFTFLNVSGMFALKGISLLLRAFAAVVADGLDVHLLLKGNDSVYKSRAFLEKEFSSLPEDERALLRKRITYIGRPMSKDEMAAVYNAADCYVSPYLAEGFNMPVLEAAACGLPVICTNGGATDDFTTEDFCLRIDSSPAVSGRAWVLLPDLTDLIAKMRRVVADSEFRQRAAMAGPAYVAQTATWPLVTDRLVAILRHWSVAGRP